MNDVVWRWFVVGYGDDHLWGFDGEMWWIFSNSLRFSFSISHPFYQVYQCVLYFNIVLDINIKISIPSISPKSLQKMGLNWYDRKNFPRWVTSPCLPSAEQDDAVHVPPTICWVQTVAAGNVSVQVPLAVALEMSLDASQVFWSFFTDGDDSFDKAPITRRSTSIRVGSACLEM